jgi:hypothetical protein
VSPFAVVQSNSIRILVSSLKTPHVTCIPHIFKGLDSDSSDDFDSEDLDLDQSGVRNLLREIDEKKALDREIMKVHKDFHHVDVGGASSGIEVFCPQNVVKTRSVKRLQTALRTLANKKGTKKNKNDVEDYHLLRLNKCLIFCPSNVCPN